MLTAPSDLESKREENTAYPGNWVVRLTTSTTVILVETAVSYSGTSVGYSNDDNSTGINN